MATIKVYSVEQYAVEKKDSHNPRVFLVFDELAQLSNLDVTSSVVKMLGFSDDSSVDVLKALASKITPTNDAVASLESFFFCGANRELTRFVVMVLPLACSRHNSPARSHALTTAVKGAKGSDNTTVVLFPKENNRAFAQACAVGRQYPLFNYKGADVAATAPSTQVVDIVVNFASSTEGDAELIRAAEKTVENIRFAQKLVDTPPNILHSDAYVEICESVAKQLNCKINVIKGHDLEKGGFGGIWGVGKAAEHLPALVVLSYYPNGEDKDDNSVCMVGKGITYDTGGLSIKTPTTSMAGMKVDMGGSAAVLGAFITAVSVGGLKQPLHALLCIAENAVSAASTRPDDILVFLSGKTVEVNNTDAEGRLVLADGVFYAHKNLKPKVIIDIATLTGAQLIATGKNHAAIYCNDDNLEEVALKAGKFTGDLTFPIPYCPEFYRNEFRSTVADMKNSVADRGNAQSSCAGQFIGNHLEEYLKSGGKWLHVDMAGPGVSGERGTGYGVALLYDIAARLQE